MKKTQVLSLVAMSIVAGIIMDQVFFGAAHAQNPTKMLDIGDETIYIGMPKAEALKELAAKYHIGNLDPEGNSVTIMTDVTAEPKGVRAVGSLTFEGGKVKTATRYWCDYCVNFYEAEPLWDAVHGALSGHVESKRQAAMIESGSRKIPGTQVEWIRIYFPDNGTVEVAKSYVQLDGGKSFRNISVSETAF